MRGTLAALFYQGNLLAVSELMHVSSDISLVRKVAASKEYTDFMASRGFGVIYAGPEDFGKFMAKSDAELGATMKAVGIAK